LHTCGPYQTPSQTQEHKKWLALQQRALQNRCLHMTNIERSKTLTSPQLIIFHKSTKMVSNTVAHYRIGVCTWPTGEEQNTLTHGMRSCLFMSCTVICEAVSRSRSCLLAISCIAHVVWLQNALSLDLFVTKLTNHRCYKKSETLQVNLYLLNWCLFRTLATPLWRITAQQL